ncbi:MAG: hypothetical protein EKK62_05235, partial [Acidimicrobiia bacterium]
MTTGASDGRNLLVIRGVERNVLSNELSLISRIESVAEHGGGKVTFVDGDDHTTLTWGQLHAEARAVAAALQARGVGPGDHVALLGPT